LCIFLFFLGAYSNPFVSLYNVTYSPSIYFAEIESKSGVVSIGGVPLLNDSYLGQFGLATYDHNNQVYAVSYTYTTDPPVIPTMLYTFMDNAGVPSQTYQIELPENLTILGHHFQHTANRSIIIAANGQESTYRNVSVWSVDMNLSTSFNTTFLFDIAVEGVFFHSYLPTEIDLKDRLFLIGANGESFGFVAYSLKTGKFLKQMFGTEFNDCVQLGSLEEVLYCASQVDIISIDLKSGISKVVAQSWCKGSGFMWDANAGFSRRDLTAFVVMNCNGMPTWYTIDLMNGTVTSVENKELFNVYGPRPLSE